MGNANSGNKSKLEKNQMATNMTLYDACAWRVLIGDELTDAEKVRLFLPLACKHVKQEVEHSGEIELPIRLNVVRDSDGKV